MKTIRRYSMLTIAMLGLLGLGTGLVGCNREPATRTSTEEQVDQALSKQVQDTFENSPAFKFPDVQVVAFKGRVQLSGYVLSEDQKNSAKTIAQSVPGVVEVENNITLKY